MNIVFFGSGDFGLPFLEKINQSSEHTLLTIVTAPDKPQGRSLGVRSTPVKQWARIHNVRCQELVNPISDEKLEALRALGADLFIVVSFGILLPQNLLDIPRLMTINLHGSLLPKYRGAAPIQWALWNGEPESGVSVIQLVKKLDAGDILLSKKASIKATDDSKSLSDRLSFLGAEALMEALEQLGKGEVRLTPQEEASATYARKILKEDGRIQWNRPADSIERQVRAMKPWPRAYTFYQGQRILIDEVELIISSVNRAAPGTIIKAAEQGLIVAGMSGLIKIKRLQVEGKRVLDAAEFLKGFILKEGARLN